MSKNPEEKEKTTKDLLEVTEKNRLILQNQNVKLEQLVNERTIELKNVNEELNSSNEELITINEHLNEQKEELEQMHAIDMHEDPFKTARHKVD